MKPMFKRPRQRVRQQPRVLTAEHVRECFRRLQPCYTWGTETRQARLIGESRMHKGSLSMLYEHPFTGAPHRWVVDLRTGFPRDLGPVQQAQAPAPALALAPPLKQKLLSWLR